MKPSEIASPICVKTRGQRDVASCTMSRVGEFAWHARIVYEIDDSRKIVTILKVAHRKDIYR